MTKTVVFTERFLRVVNNCWTCVRRRSYGNTRKFCHFASYLIILQVCCLTFTTTEAVLHSTFTSDGTRFTVDTSDGDGSHGNWPHHRGHTPLWTSSDEKDYEIVIPYQVDVRGLYLSHKISKHRWKRNDAGSVNIRGHNNQNIYINITGFKQTFHLKLVPNTRLLAPGFKIYKQKFSGDIPTRLDGMENGTTDDDTCLYSGWVISHGREPVAVSLCSGGVEGLVRTPTEDYVIKPVKETVYVGNELLISHPHKMYRKAALRNYRPNFGGEAVRDETISQTNPQQEKMRQNGMTVDITTSVADRDKRSLFKWLFLGKQEERVVEILVVADKTMLHSHGEKNLTTYVLTIFNMVSQLFHDSSIGVPIRIVLVGLVILENDQPGLLIKHHADKTLNSFCMWQAVLMGQKGRQHDHAVLLTSMDICSNKEAPCDTLGFAPIGGMCNRLRSCTVNEDSGLITAFTIAHEMGHNFGMYHDGDGNFCKATKGYIMAPALRAKDGRLKWSVCSRAYLLRFLNTAQSRCLDDKPKKTSELKFPEKLPGVLYNADVQCKWQFDEEASYCPYEFGKDICKVLWCYQGNQRCETKFLPSAEGTSCGASKWCRSGKCMKFGEDGPKPVHGGWAKWSKWTQCSRTCGGGTRFKERLCNQPLPQYGGRRCMGPGKIHRICNSEPCEDGEANMVSQQCVAYNSKPFQGWLLKWKPNLQLYNSREPCKVFCMAETTAYIFTLKLAAVDGMKCAATPGNLCVEGKCQRVGCDGIIGSDIKEDVCGQCRGDNSTCKIISGEFLHQPQQNRYFPIVVLPKEARGIDIREKAISANYLAIRNIYGRYYLNGKRQVAWPGIYEFGGTEFVYKRPYNDVETLISRGPLGEDLVLEILVQGDNKGITYEYALSKSPEEIAQRRPPHNYQWSVSVSTCSESCAGGQKTVRAVCHRDYQEEVDPGYCERVTQPGTGVFACNIQSCPPRWVPGEWKSCSRRCGGGKQRRKLTCMQKLEISKDRRLKRKHCHRQPKPDNKRRCNMHECPPSWHTGKWSKCSVSCGRGEQKRKVLCRSRSMTGYHKLPDNMCASTIKPHNRQACAVLHCPQRYIWRLTKWGRCSKTCDRGIRRRTLICVRAASRQNNRTTVDERYCQHLEKPDKSVTGRCHLRPCTSELRVVPSWHTHSWSTCSVTCGSGVLRRLVVCKDPIRHIVTTGCVQSTKPTHLQVCWMGECPKNNDPYCIDQYKWCHLVLQHKMCADQNYGAQCCRTCKGR